MPMLLDHAGFPSALKQFTYDELEQLAADIRGLLTGDLSEDR